MGDPKEQPTSDEGDKARQDAKLVGVGFLVDGVRVEPERVVTYTNHVGLVEQVRELTKRAEIYERMLREIHATCRGQMLGEPLRATYRGIATYIEREAPDVRLEAS